jgi:hypothetical protein
MSIPPRGTPSVRSGPALRRRLLDRLQPPARTIQTIRSYLVSERQWHRRSVLTKPFWTPGPAGLE